MLKLAQFAPPTHTVDSYIDGSINIIVDGTVHKAYPCYAFGSFEVPSRRYIQTYREKLGVWIIEAENNHYVYLGFSWKNLDTANNYEAIPERWVDMKAESQIDNLAHYPYSRFKLTESWIFIRGDGGEFGESFEFNSFFVLKNFFNGFEIVSNKKGFYILDRLYETDTEMMKKEKRNLFSFSEEGFFLCDRNKNEIKTYNENIDEEGKFFETFPSISVRNFQKDKEGKDKINSLLINREGINLTDRNDNKFVLSREAEEGGSDDDKVEDKEYTSVIKFENPQEKGEKTNTIILSKDGIKFTDIFENEIETSEESIKITFKTKDFLKLDAEGFKYNDKYILTEEFLKWVADNAGNFGLGNMGAPVPIAPGALTKLLKGKNSPKFEGSFLTKPK